MDRFNQLHQYLIELRKIFGDADIGRLNLEIEISGRTLGTDECLIKYKLGEYGSDVKGNRLEPVLEEFLRRNGWTQRYDSYELPKPHEDDEIQF